MVNTVKPLNSGHLRVLKKLSVIKRCPLLGGSLTKIVTIGTKYFVRYSRHVPYWEVSLYKQKRFKGICETTFKKRCANHKKSFNLIKSKSDTTLSVECWTIKQKQQTLRLTWEIEGQYKAYKPTWKKCNLCLNEKLVIIHDPDIT